MASFLAYRIQPGAACNDGRTSGNTASQLQVEFPVTQVLEDKAFFTAVLGSIADVSVSIGGISSVAKWIDVPDGNGAGLYHGSVPFNGRLGAVVVTIIRNGLAIASGTGKSISTTCGVNGLANWNAWVGSASSAAPISAAPLSMSTQVCINGTSVPEFSGLCSYGCSLGYCPIGACLCTAMGTQRKKPTAKNINAYPVAALNDNYSGLCQFDCALDYCPTGVCTTVKAPLSTPTVSPFLPNACTGGKSKSGDFPGLCGYACGYGFCPIGICECSSRGALGITPPTIDGRSGVPPSGVDDFGICKWSCERGYCPSPCTEVRAGNYPTVLVDTAIWNDVATAAPVVSCIPPCVLVLPPYKLSAPTTINFPPVTKTVTQMWELQVSTVVVVTITFAPVVTDRIPVGNINITESTLDSITYQITPSIFPTGYITFTPTSGGMVKKPTVIPYISTPIGGNIWPPIVGKPTRVAFKSGGPPGPTCASDCGIVCPVLCWACGLSCIFGFTSDGHIIKPGNCVGPWCLRGTLLGGNIVNDECNILATARVCTKLISSTAIQTTPTTSWSSTTRTYCRTTIDCSAVDSTTTRTITTSEEPDPTVTAEPLSEKFDMNDYKDTDLSEIKRDFEDWLAIAEVRISTVFITTTLQPTTRLVTSTVIVRAETKANCGLWNEGWGWSFEIANIENWASDGGSSLKKEMSGCKGMTGWTWHDRTTDSFTSVNFNLSYFIKAGCVERAIVSAGGPKITCSKNGWGSLRRDLTDDQKKAYQVEQQQAEANLGEKPQEGELEFNALNKRVYTASAVRPIITSIPNYVYTQDTASPTYEAMTWNANDNGAVVLIYTSEQFASVQTITSYVPLTATNTNATSLSGTSSSISATPGTWAVTTTHSAPSQCAASRLTMMIYSQYQIWNNAIIPIPTSTVASCFPSQFASSVIARASGTVLPAFSKLVCPLDWSTYWFNSTYIACCPRNFLLGLPALTTAGRPGLDGTCYSTISKGATVTLTSYGATALLTTTPFVIPSAGFNAFANAFDGIAANPSLAAAGSLNKVVSKEMRMPVQTNMVLTG